MRDDLDMQAYHAHMDVGREDLAERHMDRVTGRRPTPHDWQDDVPWPSIGVFLLLVIWYLFH